MEDAFVKRAAAVSRAKWTKENAKATLEEQAGILGKRQDGISDVYMISRAAGFLHKAWLLYCSYS